MGENVLKENTNAKQGLKRVLGRKELFALTVGQIIGAGIFSMVGLGIGLTGRSIWLAFLAASIFVIIAAIPSIVIGGTVRLKGGEYTQFAMMTGKKYTGFYIIVFIMCNMAIAIYALTFADYIMALVPGLNLKVVAVAVLTLFYGMNLLGVQSAAKLQNAMVVILVAALAVFIAFGFRQIQPGFFDFSSVEFMTGGLKGFFVASAIMSFAVYGGVSIMNYSEECKNPTKDLPFAIIGATLFVSVFYVLIAIVAAGVLPIEQVAFQSLTLVAGTILNQPLYLFFIIGGAMIALSTTLNAAFGWVTKPVLQAAYDGWLPQSLTTLTPKGKVPYKILTIFYLINAAIIVTGWDIGGIASSSLVLLYILSIARTLRLHKIDEIVPEAWAKSDFKMSKPKLILIQVSAIAVMCLLIYMMVGEWSMNEWIFNGSIIVLGLLFTHVRYASGKTDVDLSYEDN